MTDIFIVSGARTAIGTFGGSLASFRPADLGTIVIKEAIARAGLTPDKIENVVIGTVVPTQPKDAYVCLLYTSPSPRDQRGSRMPSSA